MPRHAVAITVCIVLGVMTSIVTALVANARAEITATETMHPFDATDAIRLPYPNVVLPDQPSGTIDTGFGITQTLVSTAPGNDPPVALQIIDAGWPIRCLHGEYHVYNGTEDYWWARPHDVLSFLGSSNQRPIPTKIKPAGLIGNVLLFGGAFYGLWFGVGRLRRKPE